MEHLAHRPSLWRRMGARPCNALRDLPPRRTFHLVREGSREVSICEPAGAPGFSERSEQWEPLSLVGEVAIYRYGRRSSHYLIWRSSAGSPGLKAPKTKRGKRSAFCGLPRINAGAPTARFARKPPAPRFAQVGHSSFSCGFFLSLSQLDFGWNFGVH